MDMERRGDVPTKARDGGAGPVITFVSNYDDWEGVYIDGKLFEEGHDADWLRVLEHLGHRIADSIYADTEWLQARGSLPKDIKDVKRERH